MNKQDNKQGNKQNFISRHRSKIYSGEDIFSTEIPPSKKNIF